MHSKLLICEGFMDKNGVEWTGLRGLLERRTGIEPAS